jgi:hypothetical protein
MANKIQKHVERLVDDEVWVETFLSKLKKRKSGCWEWQGSLDPEGYGRFHVKKHHETGTGRNFFAHRMSYFIHCEGYIEPDELILHQCHNRLCCNPDHFHIGSHDDNMDDLRRSGNIAGTNNPRSKLDEDDVWEILHLYYEGKSPDNSPLSISNIVSEYDYLDIKRGTISDIVYGRTWTHLYNEYFEVEE